MDPWTLEVVFTGLLALVPNKPGGNLKSIEVHAIDASQSRQLKSRGGIIPPHVVAVLFDETQLELQRYSDGAWKAAKPVARFYDEHEKSWLSVALSLGDELKWPAAPSSDPGTGLSGTLDETGGKPGVIHMTDLVKNRDARRAQFNRKCPPKACDPAIAAHSSLLWGHVEPRAGESSTYEFHEYGKDKCLKLNGTCLRRHMADELLLTMPGLAGTQREAVVAYSLTKDEPRWRLYNAGPSNAKVSLKNLPLQAILVGDHDADPYQQDKHFEWFHEFVLEDPKWVVPTLVEKATEAHPRCPFSQYP